MTRTFHGLRTIAGVIGVIALVADAAVVVGWTRAVLAGTFRSGWLLWLIPLALLHLLVWFGWSYRFVRELGRSYTAIGSRRLLVIHDEDVARMVCRDNELRVGNAKGDGPAVTVNLGVKIDDVMTCYVDLVAARPEIIADAPKLQQVMGRLRR